MRLNKVLTVLIGVMVMVISGCGGGGGGTGSGATVKVPITASMNTVITVPTAVGTVITSGVPAATACGLSVQIFYPAGVTFVDAVISGVTPSSSIIKPGTIGPTGTEVTIASSQGFGSGEVMKIHFSNVVSGNLPTDFGASIVSVFDCNGVQIK